MPHATNGSMPTQTIVNGVTSSSQFLDHLTSYPVVSDGIETFKSNPYGKKSLELADSAYEKFGKPIEPYFETPKQYAAPYAKKADELAESGLNTIDSHFPIVKQDTTTIVDKGKAFVWWPFKVVGDGKDYVFTTYTDEYNKTAKHKNRGQGFGTFFLAIISTELKIASDFFQAVADFLGPKYEESKAKVDEYAQYASETAEKYKEVAKDKVEEAKNIASQKTGEYQKVAEDKKEDVKHEAQKTKQDAEKEAHKTKHEAEKKLQK